MLKDCQKKRSVPFIRKGFSTIKYIFMIGFILCFLSSGCTLLEKKTEESKGPFLIKLKKEQYPKFSDAMFYHNLEAAIDRSLAYLRKIPPDRVYEFGPDRYTAAHLISSFKKFIEIINRYPSNADLDNIIRKNFNVYQSAGTGKERDVLLTGYYEPLLKGSLTKSEKYPYPIYSIPKDLIKVDLSKFNSEWKDGDIVGRIDDGKLIPYLSRGEIESHPNFQSIAPPIGWVANRLDHFFLQIQGSGKILLDTNEQIHVHYHASNGHPYRSIGKYLIDTGRIPKEEMSMQRIRQYIDEHPEESDEVLNQNPSFVFFKLEEDGPFGYLGEILTPLRSIALDRRIFPPAALVFLEAELPVISEKAEIENWIKFHGFVLNQDTGGAIRGPGRADLFWGNGTHAEVGAGHLKNSSKLYFVVLKNISS